MNFDMSRCSNTTVPAIRCVLPCAQIHSIERLERRYAAGILSRGRTISRAGAGLDSQQQTAQAESAARGGIARIRSRLAAQTIRRRLGWYRLAEGVRWPRSFADAPADLVRRVCKSRRAIYRHLLRRHSARRADADRARQRRAEVLPPAENPER